MSAQAVPIQTKCCVNLPSAHDIAGSFSAVWVCIAKEDFFYWFNSNDNCKYLFWVKSRSSQSKNVAGCYGSLLDCGKYVGFSAGNEFMSPQARKAWTGHSFILGSMILIPHIFWNGQALCYPATWLIADICVNSNLKTLLLSQILQEKGFFALQTEITFI